jgi:hypothetical protein
MCAAVNFIGNPFYGALPHAPGRAHRNPFRGVVCYTPAEWVSHCKGKPFNRTFQMSNNIIIYADFSGKSLLYLLISVKRYINYIFTEIFYSFN